MNSLDKQIRDRIESFAKELSELVKGAAVESVQEALGTAESAVRGTTRKRSSSNASRSTRSRRSPAQLKRLSTRIIGHVQANPGQRLEEIAKSLRLTTAEMKRPVDLLKEEKLLSTKGQRRGTTYYAAQGTASKGRGSSSKTRSVGRKKKAKGRSRKTSRKSATKS